VTAAEPTDDLSSAFRAGRFANALVRHIAPDMLVADEVGSPTYATDPANMPHHVVNERQRHRRSGVFTSHKRPDA
jgi:DNA replication protein DnaC